jgi:hypothetical protein
MRQRQQRFARRVAESAEKGNCDLQLQRRWIPACAGMTATSTATALDSGLRRNDGKSNDNGVTPET